MSKTSENEDQIIQYLGNIGAYQLKNIAIIGVFCAPVVWHIMVMTFMNADVGTTTLQHYNICILRALK